MAHIGEVKEVHFNGYTAVFEWRIPNLSFLTERCSCYFFSSPVEYFNMRWVLKISKSKKHIDCVHMTREFLARVYTEHIHLSIKSKTSDFEERDLVHDELFPVRYTFWNQEINPPCRIPSLGGVTLTYFLWKVDSPPTPGISCETQTEDTDLTDFSILSEEFKKLLISGTGHDVLLNVGNKQFKAHKCVLQARSPVFTAMFSNEMAESTHGSVTIEDCNPDAFGQFLQFVYSGEVDIASVGCALGLYYAGDKYDIPRLKEKSLAFMKMSFTASTVFDVISLAATHGEEELMQRAIVYFANHLEEVLLTVEWQRFITAHPIQANEIYLKAAQCLKANNDSPC